MGLDAVIAEIKEKGRNEAEAIIQGVIHEKMNYLGLQSRRLNCLNSL